MRYWIRAVLMILVSACCGAACGDLDDYPEEKGHREIEDSRGIAPESPTSDSLKPRAGPGPQPKSPSSNALQPDSPDEGDG